MIQNYFKINDKGSLLLDINRCWLVLVLILNQIWLTNMIDLNYAYNQLSIYLWLIVFFINRQKSTEKLVENNINIDRFSVGYIFCKSHLMASCYMSVHVSLKDDRIRLKISTVKSDRNQFKKERLEMHAKCI